MLERSSWEQHTANLDPGQRVRVQHNCGPGSPLLVNRVDGGYRAYCFRCDDSGFIAAEPEPIAVRLARLAAGRAADLGASAVPALPSPRVYDLSGWPAPARLWFYKAGLGAHDIGKLGAYYHPPTNRVVLPVLTRTGACVFWVARAIDPHQLPKYLAPDVPKRLARPAWGFRTTGPIVLTEDMLSAYKVARVAEAWCLLGVKANDSVVADLLKARRPVAVWLDPDWQYPDGKRPGRIAAGKLISQLRSYGLKVHDIVSRADPKLLLTEEITSCIAACAASVEAKNTTHPTALGGSDG